MTDQVLEEVKLSARQEEYRNKMLSPFKFWYYTMNEVPAGWIAGMRLRALDGLSAKTSVPFKYLNKNPFKSIYFAVQSMAAELSTAALVLLHIQDANPSIAFIIVDIKGTFPKRATGRTYFECKDGIKVYEAVRQCISTGEPVVVDLVTVGKMEDGTEVSEFTFTWSLKQRSK